VRGVLQGFPAFQRNCTMRQGICQVNLRLIVNIAPEFASLRMIAQHELLWVWGLEPCQENLACFLFSRVFQDWNPSVDVFHRLRSYLE
jgi:hypothetical protein